MTRDQGTRLIEYDALMISNEVTQISLSVSSGPCGRVTFGISPLLAERKGGRTKFVNVWSKLKNGVPLVPRFAETSSIVISTSNKGLVALKLS